MCPLVAAGAALVLGPAVHFAETSQMLLVSVFLPWLCACVLVSRGFHRAAAYATVAAGVLEKLGAYL